MYNLINFCVIYSRAQEEIANMKRKLEKYRQREWASTSDEVLLEEIKLYRVSLSLEDRP